jgi:protein-disulfide isomerase
MIRLVPVVNTNDHVLGSSDAIITLVQYADFQCANCAKVYHVLKNLRSTLGNKLRIVFRHFPMVNINEYSFHAALTAEAAALQHKFWDMYEVIFEKQSLLSEFSLLEFASDLGMDMVEYKKDMHGLAPAEKVDNDIKSGIRSGVVETPAFFINGHKHEGYFDYPTLYDAITDHIHQY